MPTDLICPECGGVIGATKRTEAGPPCTCIKIETFSPSSDTVDESPAADEARSAKPKTCCKCGRDLTGHRRFKDSVGYWCKDCHRVDKARTKAGEAKCAECGHPKPINSLQEYEGRRICVACKRELVERHKREVNKMYSKRVHHEHEKGRLLVLAAIVVVLVLIILLKKIF